MAEYLVNDTDMIKVADAIRAKGETSAQLSFPDGMVQAVSDISAAGIPIVGSWDVSAAQDGSITATLYELAANMYWLDIAGSGDLISYASASARPFHAYRGKIYVVSLPKTITKIGVNFFHSFNKTNFINCNFNGVTEVSNNAFYRCYRLLFEPTSNVLTTVGTDAFTSCSYSFISSGFENVINFPGGSSIGVFTGISAPNKFLKIQTVGGDGGIVFNNIRDKKFNNIIFGSEGNPVASISSVAFQSCEQVTSITVYTENGMELPNAPFGATNATVTFLPA